MVVFPFPCQLSKSPGLELVDSAEHVGRGIAGVELRFPADFQLTQIPTIGEMFVS